MKTRRSLLKPAGAGVLIFLGFILPAVIGAEQTRGVMRPDLKSL